MAVADVFTALTEDRPYRLGMQKDSVNKILTNMVNSGGLDKNVVSLVVDSFQLIDEKRSQAQAAARQRYAEFTHK